MHSRPNFRTHASHLADESDSRKFGDRGSRRQLLTRSAGKSRVPESQSLWRGTIYLAPQGLDFNDLPHRVDSGVHHVTWYDVTRRISDYGELIGRIDQILSPATGASTIWHAYAACASARRARPQKSPWSGGLGSILAAISSGLRARAGCIALSCSWLSEHQSLVDSLRASRRGTRHERDPLAVVAQHF